MQRVAQSSGGVAPSRVLSGAKRKQPRWNESAAQAFARVSREVSVSDQRTLDCPPSWGGGVGGSETQMPAWNRGLSSRFRSARLSMRRRKRLRGDFRVISLPQALHAEKNS